MAEPRTSVVHHPSDFHFMGEGDDPTWGGRYVGGQHGRDGDPVPGDVLVVAGLDGRHVRWTVTAIDRPYAQHHRDDQTASIWVATVRPAAPILRLV